jgi:hypothetical protein
MYELSTNGEQMQKISFCHVARALLEYQLQKLIL